MTTRFAELETDDPEADRLDEVTSLDQDVGAEMLSSEVTLDGKIAIKRGAKLSLIHI